MQQIIRILVSMTIIGTLFAGCGEGKIRVAHFNIKEFSMEKIEDVSADGNGRHPQLLAAAAIIKEVKPDILLLQEIDHDYSKNGIAIYTFAAERFMKNYLSQGDDPPHYDYIYSAPNNTGILTGLDLDGDGNTASDADRHSPIHGADSYGWGTYPGQYSMVLLSNFPIDTAEVRTFQNFLWKDLPGHHMPVEYYSTEAQDILRLSSKSHWDVPVLIGDHRLHLLISHPTPPVFDGPEDRNGRRNFDEILFWKLYLDNVSLLYDDQGRSGGYAQTDPVIIAGDLNADPDAPVEYDSTNAISQLLYHPKIQNTATMLSSRGSAEGTQTGKNKFTVQFGSDNRMQIDYLLPSVDLTIAGGGVYWPSSDEAPEQNKRAETASDHRLIWLDINF